MRKTEIITFDNKLMMTRSLDNMLHKGWELLSFNVRQAPRGNDTIFNEVYTALLLSPDKKKETP